MLSYIRLLFEIDCNSEKRHLPLQWEKINQIFLKNEHALHFNIFLILAFVSISMDQNEISKNRNTFHIVCDSKNGEMKWTTKMIHIILLRKKVLALNSSRTRTQNKTIFFALVCRFSFKVSISLPRLDYFLGFRSINCEIWHWRNI